jgi:hypothetical protein
MSSNITNLYSEYQLDLGVDPVFGKQYGKVSFSPHAHPAKSFQSLATPMDVHFSLQIPFPLIVTVRKNKTHFFYAHEFLQESFVWDNSGNFGNINPLTKKKIKELHLVLFYTKEIHKKLESATFVTHLILDAVFACGLKAELSCFDARASLIMRAEKMGDLVEAKYWAQLLQRDFPKRFEPYIFLASYAMHNVTGQESVEYYEGIRGYLEKAIACGAKEKKFHEQLQDLDVLIAMKKKITLDLGQDGITGKSFGKLPFLGGALCPLTKQTFNQAILSQKKQNLPFALLILEGKNKYLYMSALAYLNAEESTQDAITESFSEIVWFHIFLFEDEAKYKKLATANYFCDYVMATILATAADKSQETYEARLLLLTELAALGDIRTFNYWYTQTLREFPEKRKEFVKFVQTECTVRDVEEMLTCKMESLTLESNTEKKEEKKQLFVAE